ncbi:hypothetical protein ABG067_003158 [Albugo candida]
MTAGRKSLIQIGVFQASKSVKRSKVQRFFSNETEKSIYNSKSVPIASPPPITKPEKGSRNTLGQRLLSFSVGFAVAGAFGLYAINKSIQDSTAEIKNTLKVLERELQKENTLLRKRIDILEQVCK